MSTQNYRESLMRQKSTIDNHIDDELAKPMPNSAIINQMKREKLALKDKIQRLP